MDNDNNEYLNRSIDDLDSKYDKLTREIETIKETLVIRQKENTTLRVILYTGLSILLVGFIFFTRSVQEAQLENMDSNLAGIQNQINMDMLAFQKKLLQEVALVKEMKEELETVLENAKTAENN